MAEETPILVPEIVQPWWQVAGDPDLGQWTTDGQQPVDFGVWQSADGTWQLWSCIRKTACRGNTRLFYRWEGEKLTDKNWKPMGIAMTADPKLGETIGGLQAPHVIRVGDDYYMFYGDWRNICLATSRDGKTFDRLRRDNGRPQLFTEDTDPAVSTNTRDAMVLPIEGMYYCYYTAYPNRLGAVYCRASTDLKTWSDSKIVSAGGLAGNDASSAECPHVVWHEPSGHYYLSRTQRYGIHAVSTIYRSRDPLAFGIDDDRGLVCRLPVAAPEFIRHEGQWYIAALLPSLKGIQIARLRWRPQPVPGESLFDFDDPTVRSSWRRIEGDIDPVFTTSTRQRFEAPYKHFIGTAESARRSGQPDDKQVGVIESPEFTLLAQRYILYISGGGDLQTTYVSVVDARTGEELLRKSSLGNSNHFAPVAADLHQHVGRRVRIRVVDRATKGWGHINFGGISVDNAAK